LVVAWTLREAVDCAKAGKRVKWIISELEIEDSIRESPIRLHNTRTTRVNTNAGPAT
jgi:hypothetical protein